MKVADLLAVDALDLAAVWADDDQLDRRINGITATDLEDPARFLRAGEAVLTGLVWWSPRGDPATADRFAASLESAGAACLLAGEETHGAVPEPVVAACRRRDIPVLAVPAHISFRSITDTVYLRLWGDITGHAEDGHTPATPVREHLRDLAANGASPQQLMDAAFADLGPAACRLVTATGRTLARTPAAPDLPAAELAARRAEPSHTVRIDGEAGPYDAWFLHTGDPADRCSAGAPRRLVQDLADALAQGRHAAATDRSTARGAAAELVGILRSNGRGERWVGAALRNCGLPAAGPYRVVALAVEPGEASPASNNLSSKERSSPAAAALEELLAHSPGRPYAVAATGPDEAVAVVVVGDGADLGLRRLLPLLRHCDPDAGVRVGISATAMTAEHLSDALQQARYSLDAARSSAPSAADDVVTTDDLTTVAALVSGIPAAARAAFAAHVLGPLVARPTTTHTALLSTLALFLANNGSWIRTAEDLDLHVNTVRYRIARIEHLIGRDLGSLDDRLDVRVALLCPR
ncbi:PucR family transcriptional regulator [Yinghuangia seranimata]|uniref:PucR family transcriptional regulator n=1 Tax=Yinghuangia seranimata TaxID=408067 RepID=UPI00248B4111|nr:PucR family transcriptional regulator [Yinghuangia seranimata]MDI2124615.1 PucR family transcriptional regulator [Yinghuangia seranimata]